MPESIVNISLQYSRSNMPILTKADAEGRVASDNTKRYPMDCARGRKYFVTLHTRLHIRIDRIMNRKIKLFLTDVDGTLTDGGMYYTADGDYMKKFNTRDGMGLQLLQREGVKVGIVTSETTRIVSRRAEKLGLDYLVQGKRDGGKLAAALDICNGLGITIEQTAYIGDDVNCAELLSRVGVAACPSDAMPQVKRIPGIRVMSLCGGEGCVREFINQLLEE